MRQTYDAKKLDMIVLAGGKGTRLREVISDVPKPLAPVNGRPFLDSILNLIAQSGQIKKVVLSIGYLAHKIVEHYQDKNYPFELEFCIENTPLGTGGALKEAIKLTNTKIVLGCNADSIANWDLNKLINAHVATGATATLGLIKVDDASRFGTCIMQENTITGFQEKRGIKEPGLINLGIYAFNRSAFDHITETCFSLENDVLPSLASSMRLTGQKMQGPFLDIGLPETYAQASDFLLALGSSGKG